MKKRNKDAGLLLIPALLAGALTMSSPRAATGEVQFFGEVSVSSCDVTVEVNGIRTTLAQMGTAPRNGSGPLVRINLKPDMSLSGCQNLPWGSGFGVLITWMGPFMPKASDRPVWANPTLLKPQSGLATDALVELLAQNSTDDAGNLFDFGDGFPATKNTGAEYIARLKGGTQAGDYQSAAVFVMQYP